jgi:hypothetical protein
LIGTPGTALGLPPLANPKRPLFALTAMVVGSMVGAGIFSLPRAFGAATGPFAAIIAWTIRLTPSSMSIAGANASVLPGLNTASLVGFGAVVAALPAFAVVRDGFLVVPGGSLVSIAVAANVMGGITGSASGGLIIAERAGRDLRASGRDRGH